MRKISAKEIEDAVELLCFEANVILPKDTLKSFELSQKKEKELLSKEIFDIYKKNAKIAKAEKLPICQDTGLAIFFVELGNEVFLEDNLYRAIDKGVAKGYKKYFLRPSVVSDPLFERKNTKYNTPAIVHLNMVRGDRVKLTLLPKGAGSENMSALRMFSPTTSLEEISDFILNTVKLADASPCPPTVVGVGIGGDFELAAILSKKSLMRTLGRRNKDLKYADFEAKVLRRINKLGIGPQGFGGETSAFAVHIEYAPCHMASLPVAVNIGCHVHRHASIIL